MDENNDLESKYIKDDAFYEELYRRYVESRKNAGGETVKTDDGKATEEKVYIQDSMVDMPKKKFPVWIILVIAFAALLVIAVMLIKPWSLFDNGEGESVDIYATEAYTDQQLQENMETEDVPGESAETAADVPEETQAEADTANQPDETASPDGAASEQAPESAPSESVTEPATEAPTQNAQADQPADGTVTDAAESSEVSPGVFANANMTGNTVQDNSGAFSQNDIQEINAIAETGELAFSGVDFFVITNSGNEGMSNTSYATEYYKKLVSSGKATGNGILIFINTSDMTVNIVTQGTAAKYIDASGRRQMTEEFVNVYQSSGSYADAARSAYYIAQDLILNGYESDGETIGDTSDSWIDDE